MTTITLTWEREISASEAVASQGNVTMTERLSTFDNVSSVRDGEAVLTDSTQNENEMQVWTQRVTQILQTEMGAT